MARVDIVVNGSERSVEADGEMPLLWVLRDLLGLTGTKYGCGIGACGACTVLQGDTPVRSCRMPLERAAGRAFTTIEGLPGPAANAVQRAWLEEGVSQCGYCQAGMILRTEALLARTPRPTEDDVDAALDGHVCRCGSYGRIRRAVRRAAAELAAADAAPGAPGGGR